jgi:shikimate kinase
MEGIGTHIVLIGFMGSGKTTVGKMLADVLHMEFLDMDSYIEKQQNCTIKEIFADRGEAYFRELESKTLSDILSKSKKMVVSTGGGAPCHFNGMDKIKSESLSVYLKVGRQRLVDRLKEDTQRPLLQNKTDKELLTFVKTTLGKRENDYLRADIRVRAIDSPSKLTRRLTNYILKTDL